MAQALAGALGAAVLLAELDDDESEELVDDESEELDEEESEELVEDSEPAAVAGVVAGVVVDEELPRLSFL